MELEQKSHQNQHSYEMKKNRLVPCTDQSMTDSVSAIKTRFFSPPEIPQMAAFPTTVFRACHWQQAKDHERAPLPATQQIVGRVEDHSAGSDR